MERLSTKTSFMENFLQQQRELGKRQKEYKKLLLNKEKTRNDSIIDAGYENAITLLDIEKNELRAQIWIANGEAHQKQNKRHLDEIRCHVQCIENLGKDIRKLKVSVTNMEREIRRVDRQIYELNLRTIPDSQHQEHVERARRKVSSLENKMEVCIRQECGFNASNKMLREQIIMILNYRTFFNVTYTKTVRKLNSDKKYLITLIEYALNTFDDCIDIYDRMENLVKRKTREQDMRKVEMQGIMRQLAADSVNTQFMETKGQTRIPFAIQPKELKRREEFRRKHRNKINLYNSVLEKILEYTNSRTIRQVIQKFQEQESIYYSYFSYANEMSYHMTLLNNCVNKLFKEVTQRRKDTLERIHEELEEIDQLEKQLQSKNESNLQLSKINSKNATNMSNLLEGFKTLCNMCDADVSKLNDLVGPENHVNLVEYQIALKVLEKRLQTAIACVYMQEREIVPDDDPVNYVVRNIEKICDPSTLLDDIVLTQQCPECVEGEAFHIDDCGTVTVDTISVARKKICEKITQPEMQYRLHSLSKCRMARSRELAAKRHT